eukprot:TRINITY_DN50249_c0_g1_i1.p1 TRINITY_DN50249_c0_g1~~TRINITY_DN50249_c0_g1_i1.p1  ORF type:complete len:301 (+),score=83.62 TRINITY_DN50249_c0_g1_i1:41-943(+)
MPGLADLVLAEDEFDLGDDGLAKELAELQARRSQLTGEDVEKPPDAPAPKAKLPAPKAPRRSLADTVLASAGETEVAVDKELEAMERELQKHIDELRSQQRGGDRTFSSSSYKPATVPVAEPEATQESAASPGGPEAGAGEHEPAPTEELHELRDLAAKMDEAFPEPDAAAGEEPSEAPRQATLTKLRTIEKPERGSAPIDEEVVNMKDCLEDLDIRLRALQKKQALLIPTSEPDLESTSQCNKFIEEMRAQNQHLRERLQGERLKGRLDLDRGLFGATPQRPAAPAAQAVVESPKQQAD